MNRKPTIKEIAKMANVSIGTVDRVLHNRGEVSKSTRKLIEDIMTELDFVPNSFARNLALNKNFNIAVLLPEHKKGEYWTDPVRGSKRAMEDLKSLGVRVKIYLYNQKSKDSFNEVSHQVLKDKNDALVLAQVLFDETQNFLADCAKADLPFVLIGSSHRDTHALTHIGQDTYQSGRLAAELISIGQEPTGMYLILDITKAKNPNYNVKERIEGFHSFFKDYKKQNISITTFSVPQEAPDLVHRIKNKLAETSQLKGIFVPNSKSYILAEALPEHSAVRIVGYDLLDRNKALLKRGVVDFLINQRPYEQAYQGVEYLYKYLGMNQKPPRLVNLPLDIVTREKLMYY